MRWQWLRETLLLNRLPDASKGCIPSVVRSLSGMQSGALPRPAASEPAFNKIPSGREWHMTVGGAQPTTSLWRSPSITPTVQNGEVRKTMPGSSR